MRTWFQHVAMVVFLPCPGAKVAPEIESFSGMHGALAPAPPGIGLPILPLPIPLCSPRIIPRIRVLNRSAGAAGARALLDRLTAGSCFAYF